MSYLIDKSQRNIIMWDANCISFHQQIDSCADRPHMWQINLNGGRRREGHQKCGSQSLNFKKNIGGNLEYLLL